MSHIKIEKIETGTRYSIAHGSMVKSTPSIFMAIHMALTAMLKTGDSVQYNPPHTPVVRFTVTHLGHDLYDLYVADGTPEGVLYSNETFDNVVMWIYEHSRNKRFEIFKSHVVNDGEVIVAPVDEMTIREMGNDIANNVAAILELFDSLDYDWEPVNEHYSRIIDVTNRMKSWQEQM